MVGSHRDKAKGSVDGRNRNKDCKAVVDFRNIELAHRTATVSHLGNIAYGLKRPLKWDPVKEQIIGDPEANCWLDREKRQPWNLT